MDTKLSAIKAIVCQDCPKNKPQLMRDEKEVRQMAVFMFENKIECPVQFFIDWIFYKNNKLEKFISKQTEKKEVEV